MNSLPFGQLKSFLKILGSIWKPGIWPTARDFSPAEAIFPQEYFVYYKGKWCTAGGKDPLFGHVDGFQIDPKIFFKDFNWSSVWARGSASHPEGTCPWRVLEETLRLKCWRHRGNCSWVPRRRQHSNSVSFRFSQGWRPGYRQHNRAERNPFHTIGEVTFTFAKNCVVSSALLCRNLGPTIRKRAFWVNIRCSDGPVLAVRREWSCAVLLILPSLFHSTFCKHFPQKRNILIWQNTPNAL